MVAISWKHSPYMSFEHLLNWFVGLASMSFLVPSYLFIYFSLLNHFSLLVSFLRIKIIPILFFFFFSCYMMESPFPDKNLLQRYLLIVYTEPSSSGNRLLSVHTHGRWSPVSFYTMSYTMSLRKINLLNFLHKFIACRVLVHVRSSVHIFFFWTHLCHKGIITVAEQLSVGMLVGFGFFPSKSGFFYVVLVILEFII